MSKKVKVVGVGAVVNHNPIGSTYELLEKDAKALADKGVVKIVDTPKPKPKAKPKAKPKSKKESAPKKATEAKAETKKDEKPKK